MTEEFTGYGFELGDGAAEIELHEFPFGEVPWHLEVLPETGQEIFVLGDTEGCKEFNHRQGDNPFGFRSTCGLVSCEDVLRQFGIQVTEADVVRHAMTHGLCALSPAPERCGGTSPETQARILADAGVPAHPEVGGSLRDLEGWIRDGHGVILEVNAGELWDKPAYYDGGAYNHAIVLTGVAVDPATGEIAGYYINDSGRGYPEDSGRLLTPEQMQHAWADCGGNAVITDLLRAH